jgi:hypothetical protein
MPPQSAPTGDTDPALLESPAVLAAALEAYLAFDATGRVVAWNPAAEATFGYTRSRSSPEPGGGTVCCALGVLFGNSHAEELPACLDDVVHPDGLPHRRRGQTSTEAAHPPPKPRDHRRAPRVTLFLLRRATM